MRVQAGDIVQCTEFKFLYVIGFRHDRIIYHHMQYESDVNDDYFNHTDRWVVV